MKRIILGVLQAFGLSGSAYGARTAVIVGVNTSVVIPQGFHLVECDTHVIVRTTYDGGTNWITVCPVSDQRYVYSDGFSTEFRGDATGGTGTRSQVLPLA